MPQRKKGTPKQRLNTTVKPNTVKMLDAICKETGLDRGQTLDGMIMHVFHDMGLALEDGADIPARSAVASPVPD